MVLARTGTRCNGFFFESLARGKGGFYADSATPGSRDHHPTVRLLTVGEQEQTPAPLVRVGTCGLLTLEIVQEIVSADPPQARYAALTPDRLRGRGVGPALSLLKLLVSRPQRFAPADWLLEQFCRGEGEAFSSKRLDTLAWLLRDLLCPSAYATLRRQIVAHTRAMSGVGYQLAGYPLVWVDVEALSWHVEQAVRMERFGDDSLPFWQRAYELAKRGEYLPDEAYSEWAEARREEIAGLRRQSVLALARLLTEREGKAGEEEALALLRSSWTAHPRDEDILRPLMELLGKRECYQEALDYYAKLCRVLEEDGQQPDPHTQDVVEYLRAEQIQRSTHLQTRSIPSFNKEDAKNFQQAYVPPNNMLSAISIPTTIPLEELTLLGEPLYPSKETLHLFSTLTETCRHLSEGSELRIAEQVLWTYLPKIEALARLPSEYQKEAASIASQGYLLAASLVGHHNDLFGRLRCSQQAFHYGKLADDLNLQVVAMRQIAIRFDCIDRPDKV